LLQTRKEQNYILTNFQRRISVLDVDPIVDREIMENGIKQV
jgi:hypothetical protein